MQLNEDRLSFYVLGVYDKNKNYAQVHHVGRYADVNATYEAMVNGAKMAGLDLGSLVFLGPMSEAEANELIDLTKFAERVRREKVIRYPI